MEEDFHGDTAHPPINTFISHPLKDICGMNLGFHFIIKEKNMQIEWKAYYNRHSALGNFCLNFIN